MKEIGQKIRALRQDRRMTLEELSSLTGLSKSYISEAERGIASISITALQKIAHALDLVLSDFFPGPSPSPNANGMRIVRAAQRTEFRMEASPDRTFASLAAHFPGGVLEPLIITLMPGHARVEPYTHPGEEFVLVLEGMLTVLVDGEEHELGMGDTVHLSSLVPHNWENRTDRVVRVAAVSTPKIF